MKLKEGLFVDIEGSIKNEAHIRGNSFLSISTG